VGGPLASAALAKSHEGKDVLTAVTGKAANTEIGKDKDGRSSGGVTRLSVQFIQRREQL